MKKTTQTNVSLILLMFFGFLRTLQAQDNLDEVMRRTTPEQRAEIQTNHMKERLALTEDQILKVHDINLKYAKKMQEAHTMTDRKAQKFKHIKTIHGQKDQEMKGILTPSQFETYEKNKEEMKEKVKAKMKEKQQSN